MLALGVMPVGVTEWYGDQPFATWPWAQDARRARAGGAVAPGRVPLRADRRARARLIIGTNAGLDEESYG